MSESSKMGLFGSKDKNKEQKKEQSKKEDSPDRYAPYCIDSDSETYDTEALSIMDINDIIGVQSDPVGDSTLESEIAALSQIITDSKVENNQMNIQSNIKNKDMVDNQSIICGESIIIEKEQQVIAGPINVSDINIFDNGNTMLQSQTSKHKDISENPDSDTCISTNTNLETDSDPTSLSNVCTISSKEVHLEHGTRCHDESYIKHSSYPNAGASLESTIDKVFSETTAIEKSSAVSKVNINNDHVKNYNIKHDVDTLVSVEGISESLQLIGEAYISEDSQETNLIETDLRKEALPLSFTDISLTFRVKEEGNSNTLSNEKQIIDNINITCENLISKEKLKDSLQHKNLSEDFNIVEETLSINNNRNMEVISIHNLEEKNKEDKQDTNLTVKKYDAEELHNIKDTDFQSNVIEETLQKIQPVFDNKENKHTCEKVQYLSEHKEKLKTICVTDTIVSNEKIEEEEKSEINNQLEETCSKSNNKFIDIQALENESNTENKKLEKCKTKQINPIETVDHFKKQDEIWNKSETGNLNCTEVINITTPDNGSMNKTEDFQSDIIIQSQTDKLETIKESNNEEHPTELCTTFNLTNQKIISINTDTFDSTCTELNTKNILTSTVNSEKNISNNNINSNYIENPAKSNFSSSDNITENSLAKSCYFSDNNKSSIISDTAESVMVKLDASEFKSKLDPILPNNSELLETCVSQIEKEDCFEDITISNKSTESIQMEIEELDNKTDIISDFNKSTIKTLQDTNKINDKNDMSIKQCSFQVPIKQIDEVSLIENNNKNNNSEQVIKIETKIHEIKEEKQHIQKTFTFVEDKDKNVASLKLLDDTKTSFSLEENKIIKDKIIYETSKKKDIVSSKLLDDNKILSFPLEENKIMEDKIICETNEKNSDVKDIGNIDDITHNEIMKNNEDVVDKNENLDEVTDEDQIDQTKKILEKEMDLITNVDLSIATCASSIEENITKENVKEINQEPNGILEINASASFENTNTNFQNILQKEKKNENLGILVCTTNDTIPILSEDSVLLMEKADIESSIKSSISENNLINILENTPKMTDMFSEEQCQNTQDIMESILDNVTNVTDLKHLLSPENNTRNESEDGLQQSVELTTVENEDKELVQKLPEVSSDMLHKEIEAPNLDSLEELLDLDLIPESDETTIKDAKIEEVQEQVEAIDKDVDMTLFLQQPEDVSSISENPDYIEHVINNCLTDRNDVSLEKTTGKVNIEASDQDKIEMNIACKPKELLKINDDIITMSLSKNSDDVNLQKQLDVDNSLQANDLDVNYVGNPLESVENIKKRTSKLEVLQDILVENTNQNEHLNETSLDIGSNQATPDISELESAVKFLQESEEQAVDTSLVLSPKMVENVVNDISKQTNSNIFVQDGDICNDTSELVVELQGITSDSISISEAEIISEAAKLENERKIAEQIKANASISCVEENKLKEDKEKIENIPSTITTYFNTTTEKVSNEQILYNSNVPGTSSVNSKISDRMAIIAESIPKVSILEERLKEPPKIEIPTSDITRMCETLTNTKDSLLIPKDAKISVYQKMLESPKSIDNRESKIVDTPKKEIEKHDFENVGSPRIILKIVKSAIAECAEPRSPKSPKIRSATNSPNPEDSPGQKLGKIKLKLSKGGHPSIISNEIVEDVNQWHTESAASLSPIGMKIKLSKTGDASILSTEKYESMDDLKEIKHKFEETKRTESPLGMKIKLSKTGDASIVQQDSKDITTKYKEKLDVTQGSPKRTDSPIGMKIKLLKTGDASIVQSEKQEICEDHKDGKLKEKVEIISDPPKRTESPIGMKLKLSKSGDVSIVSPDAIDEGKDMVAKSKERLEASPEIPKRTDSPIGMKIKLSKTKGGASIISIDNPEEMKEKVDISDIPKRTESPFGMKIKLSKSGDASIIHSEVSDDMKEIKQKEKTDVSQDTIKATEVSCGMKIKMMKYGETSVGVPELIDRHESNHDASQRIESIGMKIKFSKSGDASIVPPDKQEQVDEHKCKETLQDLPKRTESPIGMKIKLSKTGDASIIQNEVIDNNTNKNINKSDVEYQKNCDTSICGKIKTSKTSDAPLITDSEKKEKQQKRKEAESPLEMKIKLSKTGHPTIVPCETHGDSIHKIKDTVETTHNFSHRYKESVLHKDSPLKILKTGHSTIMQSTRSELTIEPVQIQGKKMENAIELSSKRKEITISPIEMKKSKLETQLSQILPEVTIQPVISRDQKQLLFDPKTSLISRQQMNVISQEISITQVRPSKQVDVSMSDKLKDMLSKNVTSSPIGSDCEIIEHRPELIIVNENSNSSQDVMIIEEVPAIRMPEVKMPKKRGRPRRNPLPPLTHTSTQILIPRDPLALDEVSQVVQLEHRENERPRRTCRNQKSYAPPKRGRGRGRGKRKLDNSDLPLSKKSRVEQDLNAIEASTMAIITLDESPKQEQSLRKSSELYKALKQPPIDIKNVNTICKIEKQSLLTVRKDGIKQMDIPKTTILDSNVNTQIESVMRSGIEEEKLLAKSTMGSTLLDCKGNERELANIMPEKEQKTIEKTLTDKIVEKTVENARSTGHENKEMLIPPGHPNWLTPTSKRQTEATSKNEPVPSLQVIDEETRMSAESNSRSQTPARNISTQASETIINEESQGSVLSTATTESEKVKVKNRRMEINFDPDEGPFTVDKIAEYEWPLDRKGETFMIQEQISQYLGVKSFKRKYPDLKRRMVDMEERNYLRENGLVSEAMCDMGLTAVCSSEVLDVMCSDFPDQYEEYRKHMREKQVKEHSKKQKELTAAANAERNRIDLAEMAIQSALSWNISLNKSRKENRKCSLDLQTFTIHVPKKHHKLETDRKINHYPVALIPGQYTDYYREYTPAELRYYPLNTVLYGPMRPNERKFDSQSEGSQSDSDSDTSTDDSSSTSSEGTQDTEGSQSTMDDVDMEINNQKEETKLKCKMCLKMLNKHGKNEVLIQCGTCNGNVHPSCIELTLDMVPHIQSYAWQCTDCKTCAQCHDPADEDKMLFCDMCDRGYHIYCVGLRRVPVGRWHCQECAVCANCGSKEPGGANSDRNSVAQWQHEYKKGDKNTRVYVSTLCVPCSKLV
ncbi:serine-rich adhesin for platelets isoform X3 [Vespula squamosa]|uniref:Serine-rich adhesin for platelets isoform X3 n=1 Tax=Vespula squamosa TaxID=30214 RepID=A0ABD2A8K9_VESSQ